MRIPRSAQSRASVLGQRRRDSGAHRVARAGGLTGEALGGNDRARAGRVRIHGTPELFERLSERRSFLDFPILTRAQKLLTHAHAALGASARKHRSLSNVLQNGAASSTSPF